MIFDPLKTQCFGNRHSEHLKWKILKQSIWWTLYGYLHDMIDIWFRSKHQKVSYSLGIVYIQMCCVYSHWIYLTITFADCSNLNTYTPIVPHTHPIIRAPYTNVAQTTSNMLLYASHLPRNEREWKSTNDWKRKTKHWKTLNHMKTWGFNETGYKTMNSVIELRPNQYKY